MESQKIIDHIIQWLNNYLNESKTNGYVVGVSGGIDSAVVSTLCAQTGRDVILMNLPIHQSKDEVTRGEKHIELLSKQYDNVQALNINLTGVYDEFVEVYNNDLAGEANDETRFLVLGNSRSRLRMTILYAVAGSKNMLVCGTGNKIEDFGVGFFTKYGDGGVDLSPIADLYKTEVYQLGKTLGVIPEIMRAQPTDGLWDDNRTDEDQIGATYEELEWAMDVWEQEGGEPDFEKFSQRQKKVFEIFQRRHKANKHKMHPIPVCEINEGWR